MQASAGQVSSHGKLQSVLYVDDDPDICEIVQASLSVIGGLEVHTAGSGEQALDIASELNPDLVLMDVMMPGLDGPSTLKRMRETRSTAHIPVIFLTAKVLPTEVMQFRELGAVGVIGKPFDPMKLPTELFTLWSEAWGAQRPTGAPREPQRVPAKAGSLSERFLERAQGDVARILDLLERAREGDTSCLAEVVHAAHAIHGAGAMFGFPRLSASAGDIERLAEELESGSQTMDPADHSAAVRELLDSTMGLARQIETAGPGGGGMFQGR
jgi:CheY-like chemotaxis protein